MPKSKKTILGWKPGMHVQPVKVDNINPAHYRQGGIETIEYLEAIGVAQDFCAGNAIKYLSRYKLKNGIEDVKKAKWYVDRLVSILEKRNA
jgi:hypothetical protein